MSLFTLRLYELSGTQQIKTVATRRSTRLWVGSSVEYLLLRHPRSVRETLDKFLDANAPEREFAAGLKATDNDNWPRRAVGLIQQAVNFGLSI